MTDYQDVEDQWKLIAQGPCYIEPKMLGNIKYHIGDTLPEENSAYHVLRIKDGGLSYPSSQNVYMMTDLGARNKVVFTEVR